MTLRAHLSPLALSLPFALIALGCSLDAKGIVPPADAATKDDVVTKPEAGLPATNWCSTTGAGHDFCADFDASLTGTEPGAWCNAVATGTCGAIENSGTLTLDTSASTSAPASANAKTTSGGGAAQGLLTREFPGDLHPLSLAFDVRIDAMDTGKTALASITLETVGGNAHRVVLQANPGAGDGGTSIALGIVEVPLGGEPRTTANTLTLPLNQFARVEIRVGIAPNNVTVLVNGVASNVVTIDAPGNAMGRAVELGLRSTPAAAWQLHVDDVTFDFTK
jgi:hypothetical protein